MHDEIVAGTEVGQASHTEALMARSLATSPSPIESETTTTRPEAHPLIHLTQEQVDAVVSTVPGGASNVQDLYPLSPLQEGMLFHRLLSDANDPYVLSVAFELSSSEQADELLEAVQKVVNRHDALRSAILWERLPEPLQVIYRQAGLPVHQLVLDPHREVIDQINEQLKPQREQIDLRRAPLMRLQVTPRPLAGRWYAVLRVHHLVCDHGSLQTLTAEILAYLQGQDSELSEPVSFRAHVAWMQAQRETDSAQQFFRGKLADLHEPTAPFGLMDVHGDGSRIVEARQKVEPEITQRIRATAQRLKVSAARLFHAAWALVVAHTSGRDDIVYGTVLLPSHLRGSQAGRMVGMAVNTLPLRLRLQGFSAEELVEETSRALDELLNYEQTPLTVAQSCSDVGQAAPLFTSLLNCRRSDGQVLGTESGSHSGCRVIGRGEARTNYPIALTVEDSGTEFLLIAHADRRIDARRLNGYLHAAMASLMEALEQAPQTQALSLSILPASERRQLIELFNATQAEYPQEKLIHELFEEQVERTPFEVAVICRNQHLTYRQLNQRANQLARFLRNQGTKSDCFVGLCVDRGIDMIVGLLGILKAGAAYLPLDPSYPRHRLEHMIRDAAPIVVLTHGRLKGRLPDCAASVLLDTQWSEIARQPPENFEREALGLSSSDIAYVIYTSGSTGQPKGVAIEHRNAVNLICWARSAIDQDVFNRTLQSTSLNFDLSVYECFIPLTVGGSIRVVENALAVMHEPADTTLINTVPSAIKALLDTGGVPHTTRVVNLAGEALKQDLVERIFASSTVECVCNLYGPSETTTYSTWISMPRERGFNDTIGRPIANTQIYILDQFHHPVPIGVIGELYIGGAGVARGYLNRPELTAERFIRDPFSSDPKARMYKTGDLGRWRAGGVIEYLGRNDHQVKIRGFRIELGEIEAQLSRHEQVKEAVVLAREDVPGEKRLVAYLIASDPADEPGVESLRGHLKATLPEYMVPSAFVVLEKLPLTPNGKLDRRALPAPELEAYGSRQYEAPQGEVEETLAGIWQELLRVERVGRHDNFFELGGHSLLIVQMLERLRRVGMTTQVRSVFESTSLAELASVLTSGAHEQVEVPPNLIPEGCEAITPEMLPLIELTPEHIERIVSRVPGGASNIQDLYPLAPLQEGILFHHLLSAEGRDAYIRPMVFSVSSRQRLEELIAALQGVIDRHDVLRTAVLWEELPQPVQVVYRRAGLPVEEVTLDRDRDPMEQAKEWLEPKRQQMNLRCAPLVRMQIAADPHSEQWYVLLQMHHIAGDNVAQGIVIGEIAAYLEGRAEQLPASIPYRNHVAQVLAYARTHDAEGFFRSKLSDIDEPTAPFGLMEVHGDGSEIEEAHEPLELTLSHRIRAQVRRLGVSAATLFHAGWGLVVAHTSGREDVVFGSVLLGRMQGSAGGQRILGMFINTLPLRLKLQGVTAKELIEQTQHELVELLTHEQASLAVAQRCSGIVGTAPLFTALLNYRQIASEVDGGWSGAEGVQLLASTGRTNYPITLSIVFHRARPDPAG